ncbi:MAG: hypothetical protein ACO3FN_12655, partial [Vulcanococcus sp.]
QPTPEQNLRRRLAQTRESAGPSTRTKESDNNITIRKIYTQQKIAFNPSRKNKKPESDEPIHNPAITNTCHGLKPTIHRRTACIRRFNPALATVVPCRAEGP